MSFDTLQKFSQNLRDLPRVVAHKIAERAAEKITELGRETFDQSQDAYGTGWVVGAQGQTVDLVEKGDLRAKLSHKAIGAKLRSVLGVSHAKYQVGKRPVYPKGALPAKYVDALSKTAVDVCREELGK